MFVKSITLVLISFAASVLADVYITAPTNLSVITGGQPAVVQWEDDGKSPSLAEWGNASISIFVGNAIQQTALQLITASVNLSQTLTAGFTPNPEIGPNSHEYFVRIQSLTLKDSSDPQYPALAFSSKFTLKGMNGTFNSTEQTEINGQSTAPIQGATPSSANSTSATPSTSAESSHSSTGAAASVRSNCLVFLFVATAAVGVAVF